MKRLVILFGLESWLILPCLCVKEGLLLWKMESKVGLNSNMSDYQTYVIGVGNWIILIKTAMRSMDKKQRHPIS